jgi:predicted DCC family thiol-disulfide oxidoreductase YuxK
MHTGAEAAPVLLFDGVCGLCTWGVQFVLRHERRDRAASLRLRFAPLGSAGSQRVLERAGVRDVAALGETMIVIDERGRVLTRSDAAARLARELRRPWRWIGVMRALPRGVRDRLYGVVARNRYRWFGKRETCMVPGEGWRERFVG